MSEYMKYKLEVDKEIDYLRNQIKNLKNYLTHKEKLENAIDFISSYLDTLLADYDKFIKEKKEI